MYQSSTFTNPFIWADVPDPDIIRVDNVYYMTSTTMHFSPGCPIMKSYDLINWEIVSYVYDILDDCDTMTLTNGKDAYGKGSWASSLRYNNGVFYVAFAAYNTGKTYIYQTGDIEKGAWRKSEFTGVYHDMSLLFDDDGRVYMIYGGGTIRVIELTGDASAILDGGMNKVIIENANVGGEGGLKAEGSHLHKLNGLYYIFLIAWPPTGSGRRIELCYRSDKIDGSYEGKVVLDDNLNFGKAGVAQGGIIDTSGGDWYALLFQDHGAVGRIPVLVPVKWENNWPVLGIDGKVPETMNYPAERTSTKSIVISDEFDNATDGSGLALQWQWNHNPDNANWSLTQRPGYMRLITGVICHDITTARNTLTQRTFGPECSGTVEVDVSNMKDGDTAGLAAFQKNYGYVGIRAYGGDKSVVMVSTISGQAKEIESVPLNCNTVYLRISFDFVNATDKAYFYYSLDGSSWIVIGDTLQMTYTLPHFTGYRFALFNFATQTIGGYVDFNYFRVADSAYRLPLRS